MSDVLKTWGTPMPIPIQKGRLGRGLASLIGETPEADARLPAHGEQRLLSLDQLHRAATIRASRSMTSSSST